MTSSLPEIQITHHARATRLRLRVEPTQIRLTVPKFCSKKQIQAFLNESEQWMRETWQKQQEKMGEIHRVLPTELKLFNLLQPIQIHYVTQKQSYIYHSAQQILLVSDRQPEQYLKAFVIAYAKQHLPAYLEQVSREIGLKYACCSIRQPKTRWGSCSAKHDIMLNSGLALFPQEITRYVCVHELAHTVYFDHSPHFWAKVAEHDSNFKQHRHTLKTTALPFWWFSS
ncbi:M48 family metallopeptidase [Acinetobacter zhairhuonensis]|uniref:M48 family metallopeptidase n=1 Tax=Acinetobacter sp. A7.4 TaxID=2919921 RepID=UPI001F4D7979|nr:SprT family zinc-dependent metalloprotease [Acinetobacter sp. A7.4]MCJ8160745.1 M48 family metallopeptidase [Acinetobacter sp. A7.4]